MVRKLAIAAQLACTCRLSAGEAHFARQLATAATTRQRQPPSRPRTVHERVANRVVRFAAVGSRLARLEKRSPSSDEAAEDQRQARVDQAHRKFKLVPRRDQSNRVKLRSSILKPAGQVRHLHSTSARSLHTSTIEEISAAVDSIQAEVDGEQTFEHHSRPPVGGKQQYPRDEEPVPFGSLVPGGFVESRRSGMLVQGILVGPSPERPRNMLLLSPNAEGETSFVEVAADDITFVLSKFITQAQAKDCIGLPSDDPMIMNLLKKIRLLTIQVERDVRLLVSNGFARIAADNPRANDKDVSMRDVRAVPRIYTTLHVLKQLKVPTPARPSLHLAAHQLMFEDSLRFVADPVSIRTTGRFTLRPKQEVESFIRVRDWTRTASTEFVEFVEKAARVQKWGQEHAPTIATRNSTDSLLLHDEVPDDFRWNDNDRLFLDFVRQSLENERAFQTHPYLAVVPTILKAVKAQSTPSAITDGNDSPTVFDRRKTREFLAAVGVVAPWENWVALELPEEVKGFDMGESASNLEPEAENAKPYKRSESRTLRSRTFVARDIPNSRPVSTIDELDNVRVDFGSQRVYVIDDVGAKELDDGISIEPASQTSSGGQSWWVHVHVADPTSLLPSGPPSHTQTRYPPRTSAGSDPSADAKKLLDLWLLSKRAMERDHTVYFPEKTFPMIPSSVIEQHRLSLGSEKNGRHQRTLVFSTRLSENGEILDTKVEAATASNFKRLTYRAVDDFLGHPAPPRPKRLSLWTPNEDDGAHELMPSRPLENEALLSDEQVQNEIKILHKLSTALMKRRAETSSLFWTFPSFGIQVTPQLDGHFCIPYKPLFYKNLPSISMSLPSRDINSSESTFTPSQVLVSEMMVLANRTAARFGVEKGVPMAYRSQSAPAVSKASLDQVLAARNPLTGEASALQVLRAGVDFLPATTSTRPGHHWPMGIRDDYGYTRATSPLRRYADLFTHWQIKSMLKPGADKPMFDQEVVEREIRKWDLVNKARGRLSKHAETFWAAFVLKLKLDKICQPGLDPSTALARDDFAEELLMTRLTGVAMRDPSFSTIETLWTQAVWIQELGLRATLTCGRRVDMPEKGEIVNVKLEQVVVGSRSRILVSLRN
ncbi:hypothetical protein ACM66B_004147 [Microbotryomycetes sp. NB124-2]